MNNKNNFTEDTIRRKIEKNFLNYYDILEQTKDDNISSLNFDSIIRYPDKLWNAIYFIKNQNDEKISSSFLENIDITIIYPYLIQKIFTDTNSHSYSNNIVDNILISALHNKFVLNNINFENDNYLKNIFVVLTMDLLYARKINTNTLTLEDVIPNIPTGNNVRGEFLSFVNFLALNNLINYNIVFWFFVYCKDLITGIRQDIFIAYLFDINEMNKIEYCKRLLFTLDITNEETFNKIKKLLDDENLLINEINALILSRRLIDKSLMNTNITSDIFYLLYTHPPTKNFTKLIINKIYDKTILDLSTNTLCKIYNSLTIFDHSEKIIFFVNSKICKHIVYYNALDSYLANEFFYLEINFSDRILPLNVKERFIDKFDDITKRYFDLNKNYDQNLNFIINFKERLKDIALTIHPTKKNYLNGDQRTTDHSC